MVIWLTGISGAGKTTICNAIWDILKPFMPELISIDGDIVRQLFAHKLGYTEPDRVQQVKRIQTLAKFLSDQDQTVLVAALYAHDDLLNWNRENFKNYFEVYIDAPLSLVQARDPKGLYANAGPLPQIVGIDVPWHVPKTPDMIIKANNDDAPSDVAKEIIAKIPMFADIELKA